ncbi:MAG: hypothetical protein ABI175_25320 [Polyangiales bacterium]
MLALILSSSGCDGDCVDGVCPDTSETRAVPGPCESAYTTPSYANHCHYSYDGDRSTKIACDWHEKGSDGEHGTETATRTYDAAGELLQIDYVYDDESDGIGSSYSRWKLTPTEVLYIPGSWSGFGTTVGRTYDRATFAWLPMPGSFAASPSAELGLTSARDVVYTWTRVGMTLTRTGGGATTTFELDDRGRITKIQSASVTRIFTYEGDVLVGRETLGEQHAVETFEYDAGGNLATWSNDAGFYEAYDNRCW